MEPKRLVVAVGDLLDTVAISGADFDAARATLGLGGTAVGRLEWHFHPFETLTQDDPPLWLPDPSAHDILGATTQANGDVVISVLDLPYAWRATLGVYELREFVDSVLSVRVATVEVRTNSPVYETHVLSTQDVVVKLELPLGHLAAGTAATWLLFDMDSTMSTRRALLPIIRACEALAAGLTAWFRQHNAALAFGLSIDADAAGRSVSWADHPLGARMWNSCNTNERDSLLALIAPPLVAGTDLKTVLKLDLHSVGTVYFDPAAWSAPGSLNDVFDKLEDTVQLFGASSRTRALFVQGSRLSDHPAPSLRVLSSGSSRVNLDLSAAAFRRQMTVDGELYSAPLNLYVLAYTDDSQQAPVAVFALHTIPNSPLPTRALTEEDVNDTVNPASVVGDSVFNPVFDSTDKRWMDNDAGDETVVMFSTPSVQSLVSKAAIYGANTALAAPVPGRTSVLDLVGQWGRSSLLLTVEERQDPQLTLLLGDGGTWPTDPSDAMRSTVTGVDEVAFGKYAVERTGLFGRRIRAVEALDIVTSATREPFVAPETPLELVEQSKLVVDSELREAALQALNSVRLYAGNTDFVADTLPDWGRPYEPNAPARVASQQTLALDPRSTKYPRLAAGAYPKQPSFHDATRAAMAVEGVAKMTYEQWMNSNPVLSDALFDPVTRTTSRPSQVELDSYIKRLSTLLEDSANSYDPTHHLEASLVGGRLKDSLDWLRMLEANSGASVTPQWLLRPTLIMLQPDAILERYEKRYPNTGLGWEARNDIREFHLPKVQGALLKMSSALADQVSADIRKWATEGSQVTAAPSKLNLGPKPQPILFPFVPRPPPPGGPSKPPGGLPILADPIVATLNKFSPLYVGWLRKNGWSLAAQRRLVYHINDEKMDKDQVKLLFDSLQPVRVQPEPTIDAAVLKALQAVLGPTIMTMQQRAQAFQAQQAAQQQQLQTKIATAENEAALELSKLQGLPDFDRIKLLEPLVSRPVADAEDAAKRIAAATTDAEINALVQLVKDAVTVAIDGYQVRKRVEEQQAIDAARQAAQLALDALEVVYQEVRVAVQNLQSVINEIIYEGGAIPAPNATDPDFVSPSVEMREADDARNTALADPSQVALGKFRLERIRDTLTVDEKRAKVKLDNLRQNKPPPPPPPPSVQNGSAAVAAAINQAFADVFGSAPPPPPPPPGGSARVSAALDAAFADVFGPI